MKQVYLVLANTSTKKAWPTSSHDLGKLAVYNGPPMLGYTITNQPLLHLHVFLSGFASPTSCSVTWIPTVFGSS